MLKSSLCGPVAKPLGSSTRLIPPWTLAYRYVPAKTGHSLRSYAQVIWAWDFCSATRTCACRKTEVVLHIFSEVMSLHRPATQRLHVAVWDVHFLYVGLFFFFFLLWLQKNIYCFSHHSYTCCSNTALHLVHLMTSEAHELNLIKTPKETRLNCIHAKSNTKAWRVIQL